MKIKFLILLPLILCLTGCFNYTEINEMSIVSGISVDKIDNEYVVGFLITNSINPNSSSQDHNADMTFLSGKGSSIVSAINDIDSKNPKKYYLGHLSSLIVSTEVAEDMENIIDFFFRNPESIKKFHIVVCEDKAMDTLKIISPQEIFPSENIVSNLKEVSKQQSVSAEVLYSEFINDILIEGKEPLVSTIKITGKVSSADSEEDLYRTDIKTSIEISSMALFKNYNLVYVTNKDESKGINVINNKVNKLFLTIPCGEGKILSMLDDIRSNISYDIIDRKAYFTIKATGSISIQEVDCDCDLSNKKVQKEITQKYEKELTKIINKGVNVTKKYKTDVFGFGNMIYKHDYDYWMNNKDQWDEIFSNLDVSYDVNLKMVSLGSLLNTVKGTIDDE